MFKGNNKNTRTTSLMDFGTFFQTVIGKKMERLLGVAKEKPQTWSLTYSLHLHVNCPFCNRFTWFSEKLFLPFNIRHSPSRQAKKRD